MGRPKKAEAQSLHNLERNARQMLADTMDNLKSQTTQAARLLKKIYKAAESDGRLDSKALRDLTVTQGINIDKTKDILRALRDLEAATDEELEVVFSIYEEDPETGERTLVNRVKA